MVNESIESKSIIIRIIIIYQVIMHLVYLHMELKQTINMYHAITYNHHEIIEHVHMNYLDMN